MASDNIEINNSQVNVAVASIPNNLNYNITSRDIVVANAESNQAVEFTPDKFIIALTSGNLPSKPIVVTGRVDLINSDISYLPNHLTIKGTLQITNCNNLTQMPLGLQVNNLDIIKCNNLTDLAEDIIIKQTLNILLCNKISKIPQNLEIDSLLVAFCRAISLSNDIKVNKSLYISQCPKTTVLPLMSENIESIYLHHCETIMLEDGITIGKLHLFECNVTFLPEDMLILGDLIIYTNNFKVLY
jgi:hypothetical protein